MLPERDKLEAEWAGDNNRRRLVTKQRQERQNCRFSSHYISTGILKLNFGKFLENLACLKYDLYLFQAFVWGLYRTVGTQVGYGVLRCVIYLPYKNLGLGRCSTLGERAFRFSLL